MAQRGRTGTRHTRLPHGDGRPRAALSAQRTRIRAVVEPVVTAAGYDLEDLSVSRAGRRSIVRVIVDADGGIDLDAVADVSRAVSTALDVAEETSGDLVVGEYQLEVSSPGVDRPLTLPRHWRRNVGRLVKVTVTGAEGAAAPDAAGSGAAAAGRRQIVARVLDADEERVVLDLGGRPESWAYAQLGPGRVQVEFNRPDGAVDEDLDDIDDEEVEDSP